MQDFVFCRLRCASRFEGMLGAGGVAVVEIDYWMTVGVCAVSRSPWSQGTTPWWRGELGAALPPRFYGRRHCCAVSCISADAAGRWRSGAREPASQTPALPLSLFTSTGPSMGAAPQLLHHFICNRPELQTPALAPGPPPRYSACPPSGGGLPGARQLLRVLNR